MLEDVAHDLLLWNSFTRHLLKYALNQLVVVVNTLAKCNSFVRQIVIDEPYNRVNNSTIVVPANIVLECLDGRNVDT